MRFRSILLILTLAATPFSASTGAIRPEDGAWVNTYRDAASRIIGDAMSSTFAWERLAQLGDSFGHRLSGSKGLEDAIQWAVVEMKKDGLENVHTEPVKVPYWVRGRESAEITSPRQRPLVMLGLGNSIGTPADGIEADVLVVHSFDDLDANSARVKGRIVLYNVPFTNYSETVLFRGNGPSRAAAHGAVAVLVRSVGPPGLRLPHTGALRYAEGVPQIPAAAITTEDADLLQRMQDRGTTPRVRLRMEAKFLPDADSFNVVGELRGRERPEEVIVVGGHIDSWDVGTGSTDDGGGCVVTWEALRILTKLNLRPRRTVRVVLWTNEENGTRGANAYRDRYREQLANHVLMLESDSGVLRPSSFGFSGSDAARIRIKEIAGLLRAVQLDRIVSPGEGADIGPSVQAANIPAMSLEADGNYFLIHHTPADTIDKIDPMDMSRASAAIAVIAYVVAEMPERLK